MKLMAIGFPKSGTTSLTRALRASGLKTAHWKDERGNYVGSLIYHALIHGRDPFAYMRQYDAITQADACVPAYNTNLWPQLDFAVLLAIRRAHPQCLLLLNYRRPEAIVDSIEKWADMQERLLVSDIPGLPRGVGGKREHLIRWIENHYDACRHFFRDDERFLEIDIEAPDVPQRLGAALGIPIVGWGDYKPSGPRNEEEAAHLKVPEDKSLSS